MTDNTRLLRFLGVWFCIGMIAALLGIWTRDDRWTDTAWLLLAPWGVAMFATAMTRFERYMDDEVEKVWNQD